MESINTSDQSYEQDVLKAELPVVVDVWCHGGVLEVESQVGHGSVITLVLPVEQAPTGPVDAVPGHETGD